MKFNNTFSKHPVQCLAVALVGAMAMLCPVRPAGAQGQLDMSGVFGDNFLLTVAKEIGGTVEIELDQEGNPVIWTAKKGVHLETPDFDIVCDVLTYSFSSDEIRAIGQPVKIKLGEQGMQATCRDFRYEVENGKAILSGDPMIMNRGGGGPTGNITGERITLIQTPSGGIRMIADSSEQTRAMISSEKENGDGAAKPKENTEPTAARSEKPTRSEPAVIEVRPPDKPVEKNGTPPPPKKPEPVDASSLEKIPEVSTGEGE